jgi:putative ABC transport system substrate-binding protein
MTRRTIALLMTFALGLLMALVGAEVPAAKIRRIAVLGWGPPPSEAAPLPFVEAFRHGLHERGWVEGDNIAIEWRWTEGGLDQFATLVAEVLGLQVEVIVVPQATTARVAQQATTTIPIVVAAANFVEQGLVASLARPGGNITGFSSLSPEIVTRRLELFKQAVPRVTRVAVLRGPGPQTYQLQALEGVARALEAVFVLGDVWFGPHRRRIADLAAQQHLPAICAGRAWVAAGCLMGYAANDQGRAQEVAAYVDKILHGAKAADLPVQQPTAFELVINLKTAQVLGLTIPPSLLFQANEVIR